MFRRVRYGLFPDLSVDVSPKKGIVLFLKPSSVVYPPEKGLEKGTMTLIEIYRLVPEAFFGGISTEEGF